MFNLYVADFSLGHTLLHLFLDSTPSVPLLRKPFLIKPRYEIDIAKRNGNQKHPRTFHFSRAQEKPFRAPKVPRGTKKPIPVALKPIPGTKKESWAPETPTGTEKHHRDKKKQSGKNAPTGRKNTIPGTKNTEPTRFYDFSHRHGNFSITTVAHRDSSSHTWNVTKRHACLARRHEHIFWHVEEDTFVRLFPEARQFQPHEGRAPHTCGMSQSATPATQNDMSTSSDMSKKTRLCDFSHRHGNFSLTRVAHLTHVE